ncbi:hypothetical protein VN97_g12241, partial [Penicillium thymicola]
PFSSFLPPNRPCINSPRPAHSLSWAPRKLPFFLHLPTTNESIPPPD